MGALYGFDVVGIDLESEPDGSPVSSTRIRSLIAAGRVAEAGRLLGRHHELRGEVVTGDARGGIRARDSRRPTWRFLRVWRCHG